MYRMRVCTLGELADVIDHSTDIPIQQNTKQLIDMKLPGTGCLQACKVRHYNQVGEW